jgi:hypothetical protein
LGPYWRTFIFCIVLAPVTGSAILTAYGILSPWFWPDVSLVDSIRTIVIWAFILCFVPGTVFSWIMTAIALRWSRKAQEARQIIVCMLWLGAALGCVAGTAVGAAYSRLMLDMILYGLSPFSLTGALTGLILGAHIPLVLGGRRVPPPVST